MHMPLVNKKYFLFYFPLSISIKDIQLKMFVFVVVKYVIYNNNNNNNDNNNNKAVRKLVVRSAWSW